MSDMQKVQDEVERAANLLPSDLAAKEQTVIDYLYDLHRHYTAREGSAGFGHLKTAEHVSRLLYFGTGRQYEVRQILPPPTNPRQPRSRF